ncbi:unnamed protein product [Porites evermanni]|uniref:Apple domain-containing protein n=1 Tax=Porites evermanni TaxID=104178 RepID=A0ABN8RX10_9CNID|nr:unnamed protein product [Porites evermanni]
MVCICAFKWRCRGETVDQCPAQETISKHALKGYTFKTIKVSSPFECLYHCHYEDRCQSYNYLNAEDICEMNNRTKEAKPNQFVPDQRRLYKKRRARRVVLGSTPLLPGESCREIKANEAGEVVSGSFWLDSRSSGEAVLAYCDMNTEANSPSKSALAPTRGSPTMVATAQLTFTANPTNWISTPAANTKMLPTLAPTQVKTVLPAQLTPSTVSASQLTATATPGIQSTATPGFRVTVVTSDVYGAGTDALLYIALIGTDGRKSGLTEIVSEPEHFETGR